MKNKLESYSVETTDFHHKEIYKAGSNHTCLAGISLDSVLKIDENYYYSGVLKRMQINWKRKKSF